MNLAQRNIPHPISNAFAYPEANGKDSAAAIAESFFVHDCVLVRRLLNPHKLAYFRKICEEVYAKDDEAYVAKVTHEEKWLREYQNGWIWEPRLREKTNNAFGYEDIMAKKTLYDILGRILGKNWYKGSASQIRRMAPVAESKGWASTTSFHLDAQWGIDHQYFLNVWTPFTSCGQTSPGLEFLLTPVDAIRKYGRYDPSIPYEPRGPNGISPRMDYTLFDTDKITGAFDPPRFWAPAIEPGDVVIFSNWCTHRTFITPAMQDTRISLEWRVFLDEFDTPMRPQPSGAS